MIPDEFLGKIGTQSEVAMNSSGPLAIWYTLLKSNGAQTRIEQYHSVTKCDDPYSNPKLNGCNQAELIEINNNNNNILIARTTSNLKGINFFLKKSVEYNLYLRANN
ncbi:hypothetical protein BpHYR1_033559 [Brachionus plicatilis]|uniref:Uncharacterized protein n=1 Tax=Brachionus plicatilis TaxID=10195 RepID=A0A3M7Q334_BRAPC|nr:hypothetical protein BpHYR1_033559 [Brachionus plicatilis]